MKSTLFFIVIFNVCSLHLHAQDFTKPAATEIYTPVPPRVSTPAIPSVKPPADAIVLFNGTNLDAWEHKNKYPAAWQLNPKDSSMSVVLKTGDLMTKQKFGDCQVHLEFKTPEGDSVERGNSGVYLQSRYEVQIYDSYNDRKLYSNGQAGSIYKQHVPLMNACKPPGEWQSYDIYYTAPRFRYNGSVETPAFITVVHNGILIQNHVEIQGTIQYIGMPRYEFHGDDSLLLQGHGAKVSYRNIWIRKI
jgi:Domain of Unknown Function (DUF1080)